MTNSMRNENSRRSFHPGWFMATFIIMAGLVLAGCSGGGSGSGIDANTPDNITSSVEGTFVDSPVQGLSYITPSGAGLTDETGRFVCQSGEMVQFMIGDVMLGETMGKDVITPMDFIDESGRSMGFNNPTLVNMGRFLQSLDADGNPENGITITQEVRDQVSGRMIDFHQSIHDFENDPDVTALFATMNGLNMPHNGMLWELVGAENAQQHMIDHMGEYMTDSMKAIMNNHMGQGVPGTEGVENSMNNTGTHMNDQTDTGTHMDGQTDMGTHMDDQTDMGTHMNDQTDMGTHMDGQTDMGTHMDGHMG